MEITNGRYRSGLNLEKEVNKTFRVSTHTNKVYTTEGRALSIGTAHIWPSYIIDNYGKKTFTFNAVAKKYWGHMQGDFDFRDGRNNAPSLNDVPGVDPAGGYGKIRFVAKESSLWHKLKVKLKVTLKNIDPNNDGTIEYGDIQFPNSMESKEYWYTNANGVDTKEIIVTNQNTNIYKDKEETKDIIYVDNKGNRENVKQLTRYYIVDALHKGHPLQHDAFPLDSNDNLLPLKEEDTIYEIDYAIPANNEVYKKECTIELVEYYAYDDGPLKPYDLKENSILLANWYQLPNILYFASMAWVQKPASKDSTPVLMPSTSVEYTDTSFDIYLFVELGISPNGGKDIYWNQKYTRGSLSLNSTLPENIARYITIDRPSNVPNTNSTTYNHSSKYGQTFAVSTVWPYGNYVKVTGTSLPNNERNNEERTQRYFMDNLLFESPSCVNVNGKVAGAAVSGPNDELKTLPCTFDVKKYTTTKPWNIRINASLQYNKFETSTDNKTFEQRIERQ